MNQIQKLDVNAEVEKAYISGCIDTSATLAARIVADDDYSLGYNVECEFKINRQNPETIMVVDEFCLDNNIFHNTTKHSDSYVISIDKLKDLKDFIKLIEPYLHERLEEARLLRNKIIPSIQNGKHIESKETFYELSQMVEQLRELNPRSTNSDYDSNYFRNKWDL